MSLKEQYELPSNFLAQSITALELTTRTQNALLRAGVATIEQLGEMNEFEVQSLRNLGTKGLQEIRHALENVRQITELQRTGQESTSHVPLIASTTQSKQRFGEQFGIPSDIALLPLNVLNLSLRSYNALHRGGVHRLRDLAEHSRESLSALENVGPGLLDEVTRRLESLDVAELQRIAVEFPQIEHLPLSALALRDRIVNRLGDNAITTLGALLRAYESGVIAQLGLAASHNDELSRAISQLDFPSLRNVAASIASADNLPVNQRAEETRENVPARELVARILAGLGERDRQIVMLRFGLENGTSYTLDEVGQHLKLTRERVRQIEIRALGQLQKQPHLVQPLLTQLERAVEQRSGVLSVEAAQTALCETTDCSGISSEMLIKFLVRFSTTIVPVKGWPIIVLKRGAYASFVTHVPALCQALKQALAKEQAPISFEELRARSELSAPLLKLTTPIPKEFMQACLNAHPEIMIEPDGTYSLQQWQTRRLDDMIQVLRQQGEPLHYARIAELVNQRLPEAQQTTARNIHGHLGRLPDIFVRVGRGIFGLAEWGLVQERSSADTAHRLLDQGGTPLDLETLIDRVLDVWQIQRTSVRAAIDLDPRFVQVRPAVYWLAGKPLPGGTWVEQQTDEAKAANIQRRRGTTPTIPVETLFGHLRALLADGEPRTISEIARGLEEGGLGPIPKSLISRVLIQQGRSMFTYERATSMISLATVSEHSVPPTYDRYDEWSQALTSFFVEGIPRGALIFLSTDDQTVHEVARLLDDPREPAVDDFCTAVRSRVVISGSVNLSSIHGHYPDGKPRGVAFLAAMVLAAARMEENEMAGPSNYFIRLRQVLGLPAQEGRPPGMKSGAEAEEPLWRAWNQWLQEQGFLPSARGGEGAERYIRYPISQALLRNADKERLRRLFEARYWTRDLEPEVLVAQLRREPYQLSQHLRDLLGAEGQRLQAVADAIGEYYDLWQESQHGDVPGGNVGWIGFPAAGLYRTEDIISGDIHYFLYPQQPRRHRPEQVHIRVAGALHSLTVERPRWYAPVVEIPFTDLDQGGSYPIVEPSHISDLRLPARSFWMLIPDPDNPDSGVYASWGNAPLGTPFLLLCRSDLVPRLVELRAEHLIEWTGEPQEVAGSDHWVEIHHCMVVSEAASTESQENQELYEALRPRETVNVSLSGGLRVPHLGAWLDGYGPTVTVFTFRPVIDVTVVRVADEDQVFDRAVPANEPCPIPWCGPGDYRIEACAGGKRTERLVKIVSWEHLRCTPVTQPERVRIGAWQVTGATIETV